MQDGKEVELKPSKPENGNDNGSGEKELATFRHRLGYLRIASVGAALIHVFVTLITMIMAFTPGVKDEYLSQSIVVCAFGCLNTCVFALVEMWRTLFGTAATDSLPSWTWHNDAFLSSVGNIFFLCLWALPALVVYVLHSLGKQFFDVLTEQQGQNPRVFGVIMFHLLSGIMVFLVDTITIWSTTAKLRTFQSRDDENAEEKEKEKVTEIKKETEDDEGDDAEDYDEHRPVNNMDRILAFLSIFSHGVFTVNLVVLTAIIKINSGTILSVLVIGLMFLGWFFYSLKSWGLKEVSESWLLNLRLLTILHLFALLLFFWIALCLVLLLSNDLGDGFFSTLNTINTSDSDRGTLAGVLIILIFVSVAIYSVILYVHSRSMWSLDEIASLYLAAKLQAKLKEDRD